MTFDAEENKVRFRVEESSGLLGFLVYVNGELLDEEPVAVDLEGAIYEFSVGQLWLQSNRSGGNRQCL